MRKILFISLLCLPALAFSQKKDTTKGPADTVRVPVPVYEKSDTVKVRAATYGAPDGSVRYTAPAYVIQKGFAVVVPRKDGKGNEYQWVEQPKVAGVLDSKKKPIPILLQFYQ